MSLTICNFWLHAKPKCPLKTYVRIVGQEEHDVKSNRVQNSMMRLSNMIPFSLPRARDRRTTWHASSDESESDHIGRRAFQLWAEWP